MKPYSRILFAAALAAAIALPGVSSGAGSPFAGHGKRGASGPTKITSDRLEFDYHNFVALFDGHVVVTDPEFVLRTDKMLVFFENTNDVKRVDCVGNVDMRSDDIHAKAGRAIYTRENAQVVLQDEPVVTKEASDTDRQSVSGETIRIWLNDERVVVENGVGVESTGGSFKTPKD